MHLKKNTLSKMAVAVKYIILKHINTLKTTSNLIKNPLEKENNGLAP